MNKKFMLKRGDRLVLATHNSGKFREFSSLFAPFGIEIISAANLGLKEPVEDGKTFKENAAIKARSAAKKTNMLALADDSGLEVEALNGEPGIYTANWAELPDGSRDFNIGMKRLEEELQKKGAFSAEQRGASFNATLCLAHPDGDEIFFIGKIKGTIIWPPKGDLGFGFDPVFMPEGYDITFGQMSETMKHSYKRGEQGLSHRARAFAKMIETICEINK